MPAPLVDEIVVKARQKPYLKKHVRPEEVEGLVNILGKIAVFLHPISDPIPAVTRDPKDDYLIAYAMVGDADFLVTGDGDLLDLGQVGKLRILTPADFAALLSNKTL